MILLRANLEPVLAKLDISGYHIAGNNLISLVSKCGKPILIFSDFNVKNSFTNAERDFISKKIAISLEENTGLIADIEAARVELKSIEIDKIVNTESSNLRYVFQKGIILTLKDNGKFTLDADHVDLDSLGAALMMIDTAKELLIKAQVKKNRIKELENIIAKGKSCSV